MMAHAFGLVLGGGGGIGIAWEIGVLAALAESGVPILEATAVVGTSAGSIVGLQAFGGRTLDDLVSEQRVPRAPRATAVGGAAPPPGMAEVFRRLNKATSDGERADVLNALAMEAPAKLDESTYLAMVQAMVRVTDWPTSTRFLPVSAEVETGARFVARAESGAPVVAAVAASCGVPTLVPPVTIAGRGFVDGGAISMSNADALIGTGVDRALIVALCGGPHSPVLGDAASSLGEEREMLDRQGIASLCVTPGSSFLAAVGSDFNDLTRAPAALECGIADGPQASEAVRRFLA